MSPALDFKQAMALTALLARRPILSARAHLRLIVRGLFYLARNPDLAWARHLLGAGPAPGLETLILVADRGRPIFSLLIAASSRGNLDSESLRAFRGLDSFREMIEADQKRPLQAILVDGAIFGRLHFALVREKGLDAFFVAGRELLAELTEGRIEFSPVMPEVEMLGSLDAEELLGKFGPRYGLGLENPVRLAGVARGLGLALRSPLTGRRMKKNLIAFSDKN